MQRICYGEGIYYLPYIQGFLHNLQPPCMVKAKVNTAHWSVSKRNHVLSGSKHLRAGVQPFTLSVSLLCGSWWFQWWRSKDGNSQDRRVTACRSNALNSNPITVDFEGARTDIHGIKTLRLQGEFVVDTAQPSQSWLIHWAVTWLL